MNRGELQQAGTYARPYRNIFAAFGTIARHEGLRCAATTLIHF